MTKPIGTGTSLKDFTRRDFLASSALTAALFAAALMLFPAGVNTAGKASEAPGPASSNSPMPRH
ncbi:hypothetical protein CN311_26685 [Mesorhizobium sanjuanii]|uniref:Twin-arginine translocation signal domain-containing protein n=1 Tax=Mesorhizobium sanjuanii TaxID=2037900 RepID=A0A2A6F8B7_9HYPH|nr:twin-arginine translocation signal domain-containing protein [Mesorhizobium sanjuanii]PDQ18084.1 hypothetical protein CN311_26685 [Mesorhizobium sanjuanii]